MPSQILSTKLYPPPPRPNQVERSHLVERLEHGLAQGRRFTLVSAPAGFGKSTLVSQWIWAAESCCPVAWLSLDAEDNDPARFLRYLTAAFQRVDPKMGQTVQAALLSVQVPPLLSLVEQLLNDAAEVANPFLLILDDYHLITSVRVHPLVQLLLERQPTGMHTVIITREDPPLPLPRLRARGQITEIRERDLRFSETEAAFFLHETMNLSLQPEDVATLETRTEGWITGLQLAAIALQEAPDTTSRKASVANFAGSDRYIVDYLVSEVLRSQPEEVSSFLMKTSILDRLCGSLCDAVLENGESRVENRESDRLSGFDSPLSTPNPRSSQVLLEELERTNLFVAPLDNQRTWYRYHHLFADLLRHSLRQQMGSQVAELHRRASRWYEAAGFLHEAVKHALKTGDWDFAAELVERHAMDLITHSQVAELHDWCAAFPEQVIQARPGLCIFSAWALMLTFRADLRDGVVARLQQVEQALDEQTIPTQANVGPGGAPVPLRDWVIGHVCAIRSQLLLAAFNAPVDPQALVALSLKSLELLPEVEKPIRATTTINLAHAHLMLSQAVEAEKAFAEALSLGLEAGNYFTAVTAIFYQARVAFQLGQLHRSVEICREGLALFIPKFEHLEQEFPAIRSLYVAEAMVRLEWNELAEAERLLELSTNRVGWAPWVELIGYAALVRLWGIRGDAPKVMEILDRMESMGPQQADCAQALRMLFLVRNDPGDASTRERAAAWARSHVPRLGASTAVLGIGPFQVDAEYMVYAAWLQVQTAIGQPQETLAFLAPVLDFAREKGITYRIVELSVIQAMALQACSETGRAREALILALSTAQPEGHVNIFNRGPRMLRLLADLPTSSTAGGYARRLLAAFDPQPAGGVREAVPPSPARNAAPAALVEPLSGREVEVLRLMATGLPVRKIAEKLYLSPNTLKAHTQNIYAKLDVHSRIEAVNKARELGLM